MVETAHRKLQRDVELPHIMIRYVDESRFSEDVQSTAEVKIASIKARVTEQYVVLCPCDVKPELRQGYGSAWEVQIHDACLRRI